MRGTSTPCPHPSATLDPGTLEAGQASVERPLARTARSFILERGTLTERVLPQDSLTVRAGAALVVRLRTASLVLVGR